MANEVIPAYDFENVGDRDRSTYIGGSAVAAILGVSPWRTPLQLYNEMKSLPVALDPEKEKMFAAARDMEPVIIARVIREYGIKVVARSTPLAPNRYQDKEHPFLAAEIDFEFEVTPELQAAIPAFADVPLGEICNGEAKTAIPIVASKKFGEEETDEIPIEYGCQVQHGLGVTGRRYCLMPVWVTTQTMLIYVIKRDDEIITGIRKQCVDFWFNNIMANNPPEPINLDDLKTLITRINGRPVEADETIARKVADLATIRKRITTFKADEESLVFDIADYMRIKGGFLPGDKLDDALLTFNGRTIATYKRQSRAGFTVGPAEFRVMRVKS